MIRAVSHGVSGDCRGYLSVLSITLALTLPDFTVLRAHDGGFAPHAASRVGTLPFVFVSLFAAERGIVIMHLGLKGKASGD